MKRNSSTRAKKKHAGTSMGTAKEEDDDGLRRLERMSYPVEDPSTGTVELVEFEVSFAPILEERIPDLAEMRAKIVLEPEYLHAVDAYEAYLKNLIERREFVFLQTDKDVAKEKLFKEKKENDSKGAEAIQRKRDKNKKLFCKIYREEKAKHGSKTKKLSLITFAIERFKKEHGEISERTAREYLRK